MMDNLRAASNHVVLKIILGLIILSFVLTGVGNYLIGGNNDYAAKVNGQEISRAQLEQAFNSERSRQQQMLGDQFSQLASNDGYMQQIRQQALSQLIDQALLDSYIKDLHLSISDDQVKQAIFNQQAFQTNGKFDNAKYLGLIGNMGFSADQYAEALRKQLSNQQLINAVANTDFMLKGETSKLVELVSQQRVIRQATLDVNALAAKQTVSDDEINQYYQQHKTSFMAPEQFRVSYILMDAASMQQDASEADIQAWYDQHKADYTQPQRNRYSVIQTKTEADANALLTQLKGGASFTELAKSKSIDPISARKGGDMGWLEPATTPDELKNAGLTEKGQMSGVIKSSVGFLIVRLDDIQPEQVKPLDEVRDAIAAKVKQEKGVDAFYKLQQKVSEAASNDNESLAGAEQASGLKAKETGWFSQDALPKELDFDAVKQAIFNGGLVGQNGAPGNNSDIISVDGDRAFVLRVSEHKPEAVKPLDQVKTQIADTLKHDKATQQAKSQADKLLADLKAGKQDALTAAGLTLSASKTVDRNAQDPVAQAAFNLPQPAENKPSWGVSEDMQGNVVLVAVDKVTTGSMPQAQIDEMVKGVTQNNAQLAFEALLQNLRKEAKIKYGAAAQMQ
ncbi:MULTISPECIES: peptidylprolyl isomerase [Pantoea]|jgi:peptidyl-prolyl cis-trans isomerase D|uniref:Periplasmic chaperone PpiD n=1 Tax=Pantoea brenneri TaxID=472694 RepID=A0A7Y6TQV7_9GAMM|nr:MULTISPECIES: peptidylprolyl isomerase [Pantoea]KKD34150.1 molecular chaperone [Pantoea sp. 3.5.1]MBZ6393931.1 peptidylprolyl isomerase [Pantoea sp.]MBZ6436691.1 peptidylprolyl isomerase [Pantoea sp.]MCQ5470905.1 peptidylprolyl isomerase [Pantoea brenneri]MDU4746478.1 peptidylprolyl isomerase [Pantoea sp.]